MMSLSSLRCLLEVTPLDHQSAAHQRERGELCASLRQILFIKSHRENHFGKPLEPEYIEESECVDRNVSCHQNAKFWVTSEWNERRGIDILCIPDPQLIPPHLQTMSRRINVKKSKYAGLGWAVDWPQFV